MSNKFSSNQEIGRVMEKIARLLEVQHANPYRINAYRRAAGLVREHDTPLTNIIKTGNGEALKALPGIGNSLSALITEYIKTGRSQLLRRLEGEVAVEDIFEQIPGIGHELAVRLVQDSHIKSLEALAQASSDGSLARVKGFGKKRLAAVQRGLVGMIDDYKRKIAEEKKAEREKQIGKPPVWLLLAIDFDYRRKAAAGRLHKIAPRRFNPKNEAWLPIYHAEKKGWIFTALFSNTARAHKLHKTHNWVVLFYERGGVEKQATVVTETHGPLRGKRVVRGREAECQNFYFRKQAKREMKKKKVLTY